MATRKEYDLNGEKYNKTSALAKCRQILALSGAFSHDDKQFMLDVLKLRYPTKRINKNTIIDKKIGEGKFDRRFYYSTDKGKTWHDFSYKKAFESQEAIDRENVIKAFRLEVREQIEAFKVKALKKDMSFWLFRNEQIHVDHVYPFHLLLKDFLSSQGLELNEVSTVKQDLVTPTGVPIRGLADQLLAKKWKKYHKKKATLQLLLDKENLSKGGKHS
jgi:hypothetical protein